MLTLEQVDAYYGSVRVLRGVSFTVAAGEVVGLLGRNGAGKTTTLKTIMGLVRARAGRITLDGTELTRLPAHAIPRHGVAYVPQGRRLFAELSVEENLRMGLYVRDVPADTRERVLSLFPVLSERLDQKAGTLSGGEQQMLAMARALCLAPNLLLLDEPSEGLMPSAVAKVLDTVVALKAQGVAVLLVEQKVAAALQVCDRLLLMETGALQHEATAAALAADPTPLERYVGVHR